MKRIILPLVFILSIVFNSFSQEDKDSSKSPRSWTILQSWDIPGKASGLAWDGNYFYFGIYGANGDQFYRFDPSDGSYQQQFVVPTIGDCFGLTWDGSSLWAINQVSPSSAPAEATELDLNGNILSTISLPDHYMSGIAYDNGDFWVGTYYPDPGTVYSINGSGTVLSQFTPPEEQIWDICTHGNNLWMVDYNANMIYKTNQSGSVLESYASENIKPSGIVYDGTYIWYVDGQISSPSKIYKVSLTGPGTPEINVPVTTHNYGAVTLGSSETWQMEVENIGEADLEITGVVIPGSAPVSTTFSPPQIISPGNSINIPLTYSPIAVGHMDVTIQVESSDPITPSVDVALFGDGVNSGPSIFVPYDVHDYHNVRVNAFTRWFLEIENIGDQTLVIDDIESNDEVFIVDESVTFPINIATLDSVLVGIWFNPQNESNYGGKLSIANNDPSNNPYYVNIAGDGLLQNWPISEALWHYSITTGYDQSPKAISPIQDITGDTVADVIICSEDNYIRCFNGNSSGVADIMWEVEIYSGSVYDQPGLSTIPDINNDGYEDVIVGTTGGDRSIIALSGKTGNEIWKHQTNQYGQGGWVYAVNTEFDYNSDGINDVLASTGDDYEGLGPKRVYCLNGIDGDAIWETPVGGPVFSVMGVEDFTGDGKADAIAGASNDEETQGRIIGINGSNGSITFDRQTGGSSVWALLQLDDITGDGIKDIAAGDFGGNYYYVNPENNSIIYQGVISSSLILRFEKMDDVNGDGYSDLLVAHSKYNGIVLNGYDGSNIWLHPLYDKSWNVAVIDDITGDDINDVLIGTLFTDNYCYYLNGVDGEEISSINYNTPIDAINSIPDIVGDGTMEMVVGGRNGKVYCYSGGTKIWVQVDEQAELENGTIRTYPNPFHNELSIEIYSPNNEVLDCWIVDLSGKKIRTIASNSNISGWKTFTWNGKDEINNELPSGFYVLYLKTASGTYSKKIAKM